MKFFSAKTKKILPAVLLVAIVASGVFVIPKTASAADWGWGSNTIQTVGKVLGYTSGITPLTEASKAGYKVAICIIGEQSFGQCLVGGIGYFIQNAIVPVFGFILGIVSSLLDVGIRFALDTTWFKNVGAIDSTWGTIRDLINIAFIFILLYIAIATILQLSSYNIRKSLAQLLLAVLLINFSMFFTKVIVDAGNIVANGFYMKLVNNDPEHYSVGTNLLSLLKISATFTGTITGTENRSQITGAPIEASLSGPGLFMNSALQLIMAAVAIYVFFEAAFMFLARAAIIVFLLITSPVGFVGSVVPGLGSLSSKWWDLLIKQTLVAPVFLILLYIAYRVAQGISATLDTTPNGVNVPIPFFFNYAIVILFLMIALKVTKSLSGQAGAMVTGWGKKIAAAVAGATIAVASGGTSLAARGAIAAGSAYAQGSKGAAPGTSKFRAGVSSIGTTAWKGIKQKVASGQSGVVKALKTGSWDLRRAKVPFTGGQMLGQALKSRGINAGMPTSPTERERQRRQEEEQRKKDTAETKFEGDSRELLQQIAEAEKAQAASNPAATAAAEAAIERVLNRMSSKDVARLDPTVLSKQSFAKALKGDDLKAIEDSKDLTAEQKNAVIDSRTEALAKASGLTLMRNPSGKLTVNTAVAPTAVTPAMQTETDKIVGNMSESEVANLDPGIALHTPITQGYNTKQVKAIRDKGRLNATQQATLTAAIGPTHKAFTAEEEKAQSTFQAAQRARAFRTAVTGGAPTGITTALRNLRGPDDWKSLDGSVLTAPAVVNALTPAHLDAIQQAGILTQPEKARIARLIRTKLVFNPSDPAGLYLNGPAGLLWS